MTWGNLETHLRIKKDPELKEKIILFLNLIILRFKERSGSWNTRCHSEEYTKINPILLSPNYYQYNSWDPKILESKLIHIITQTVFFFQLISTYRLWE